MLVLFWFQLKIVILFPKHLQLELVSNKETLLELRGEVDGLNGVISALKKEAKEGKAAPSDSDGTGGGGEGGGGDHATNAQVLQVISDNERLLRENEVPFEQGC